MHSIITPQDKAREALRANIARELYSRYEAELKGAGLWRGVVLWIKIQKEISAELKRKLPPDALYLRRLTR